MAVPTIGSLFAGIGGFDLGFERAGFKTAWQVEIDPYCLKVLEKNFPHAQRFGDIRECGKHNLAPVDVICGGFPCQDISAAGTTGDRGGINGDRSGLWSEYARIIGDLRPRYIVVENSPALTFRGLGSVLGDLASIGYDAEWDCIPAAAVGAPHLRDRIWILAYPTGDRLLPCNVFGDKHGRALERTDDGTATIGGKDWKLAPLVSGVRPGAAADWWQSQSRVVRSANGIPDWMERVKSLGNAIVPQIAELIATRLLQVFDFGEVR